MYCTNCGKELPDDTDICNNCGAPVNIPAETDSIKDVQQTPNYSGRAYVTSENINENQEQISPSHKNNSKSQVLTKYNKPLSTATFFLIQILFLIPVINLFFILFWSFKKNINENRKAYARSMLIWSAILAAVIVFVILTLTFMQYPISFNFWLRGIKNYLNSNPNI